MLQVAALKALSEHVAGRVHARAADDARAVERHRNFILTHLSVGALPFAALPALLASGAAASAAGLAAFAWLAAPIVIALNLTRTGALDQALAGVALAFGGLVGALALATGGLASPALALLLLPVIDAALSGSRRAAVTAGVFAASSVVAVAGLQFSGVTLAADAALQAAGLGAAAVYAAALGFRAMALVDDAERASAPSEDRFALFAGSVDGLVTRHAPTGAATYASPAARQLLGAAPRDLIDQGLFARVHIADRPAFLQALAGAATSDDARRIEIRLRREGSAGVSFAWVEMLARKVQAHEADAVSAAAAPVVATFRDCGSNKAHEEALVAAREEAERASLAKTRFLAHMSHELRTPLNAIIGFSEILSDETLCRLTPERRSDYAALIHRSGAHLLEVVNSILDMAKLESGAFSISPRPCALAPVVHHCLSLMELKAEAAGVTLSAEIDPNLRDVEADPRAVTQVALNLLGNAIKFTPRGGSVAVALKARRGGVALTVRDTGVGIAPEHLGRLGEAFFQADGGADRRYEGAGLGLSVVRGLVALHGGEVAVESAVGRGTSVDIYLPSQGLAAATPQAVEAALASAPVPSQPEMVKRRA